MRAAGMIFAARFHQGQHNDSLAPMAGSNGVRGRAPASSSRRALRSDAAALFHRALVANIAQLAIISIASFFLISWTGARLSARLWGRQRRRSVRDASVCSVGGCLCSLALLAASKAHTRSRDSSDLRQYTLLATADRLAHRLQRDRPAARHGGESQPHSLYPRRPRRAPSSLRPSHLRQSVKGRLSGLSL